MRTLSAVDYIAYILLLIGGINWGLVGFFNFDLVAFLFGNLTTVSKIIYSLVGVAAVYCAYLLLKPRTLV